MWIYLSLFICVPLIREVPAAPFIPCPANVVGNLFMADDVDRCVFYWCLNGVLVSKTGGGKKLSCTEGKGTAPFSISQRDICTEANADCRSGRVTTASPRKDITEVKHGYHMLNGIEQRLSSTRDVRECIAHCTTSDSCYAVDFDVRGSRCFLHTLSTVCGTGRKKIYCTHYKFTRCGTTTEKSTSAGTTAPQSPEPTAQVTRDPLPSLIKRYPGKHQFGGVEQNVTLDAYACVMRCTQTLGCAGADYNTKSSKCYLHDVTTECQTLYDKDDCIHYRLNDACAVTSTDTTTVTTTTADPTTTTAVTPTPTAGPVTPPTGYLSVQTGMHLLDGVLLLTGATEQQCLDACLMTSFCLALDYDTVQKTCWAHNSTTHCTPPQTKPNCRHYTRVPCLPGAPRFINEVRTKFHIQGGLESCTGCSLEECLTRCAQSPGVCQAVDYDERNRGCYVHTALTVCQTLVAKDYCTHFTRADCPLQPSVTNPPTSGTPTPSGIPTPQGNFMNINFIGPSVLPSGWSAYPGTFILGGTLIAGPSVDGDACVAACAASTVCYSVDFNSKDGTCWGHTDIDLKCDFLSPLNEVYHMKKSPVCAYFSNTLVQYSPSPFAVAP